MEASRTADTQAKVQDWLDHDLFPFIGAVRVAAIKPRDILGVIQRYGLAIGWVEHDVTPDLRGALVAVPRKNYAAITEPKHLASLLRAMYAYEGHAVVVAALKLTPMLFVRPGELRAAQWQEIDLDAAQWRIPAIKPRDVLGVIQRVEARGAIDSAHRIKQVCGQILRYGVAIGWVEHDVTPDLRGALVAVPRKNFAAITEPKHLAPLLRAMYAYEGHAVVVAALKLTPMLFVRPGELRAAQWQEIDLDAAQWRIPATRMRMKPEHMVPLASQAVAVLRDLHPVTSHGKYVFPNLRTGDACMSDNTINAALRYLGFAKEVMTAHGFRATARTILDEVLNERVDLIEHQLAHRVTDPNGRAYNRTAHLPARAAMMQRWADYFDQLRAGAEIIPIRPAPSSGQT